MATCFSASSVSKENDFPYPESAQQLSKFHEIPDEVLFYQILPLCDEKSLVSLNQTVQRTRSTERAWYSLVKERFPELKNVLPIDYTDDFLSYKHLYFLIKHLESPSTFENRKELNKDKKLTGLIKQTFSLRKATYLKGHLERIAGNDKQAWDYYKKAAKEKLLNAQKAINEAIYHGDMGQGERSGEERFQELVNYVLAGDQDAQYYMAAAIYYGALDQSKRSEGERFQDLVKYAQAGYQHPLKELKNALDLAFFSQIDGRGEEHFEELATYNQARVDKCGEHCMVATMYYGSVGQGEQPREESFQELVNYALADDQDTHEYMTNIIGTDDFRQGERSEEEHLRNLLSLMQAGNKCAQYCMVEAIYAGRLGQEKRSKEDRFQDLVRYAQAGNKYAQHYIVEALYHGYLGQEKRSKEDRFQDLVKYAQAGNKCAERYMVCAIRMSNLEQVELSEEERFQNLVRYAQAGYQDAQDSVSIAIYTGYLGQGDRSNEERFQDLVRYAQAGNTHAQGHMISAIFDGTLGQGERSKEERIQDLVKYAMAGYHISLRMLMNHRGPQIVVQDGRESAKIFFKFLNEVIADKYRPVSSVYDHYF